MVYAQAVAEKGFDIVFQASSQIPTICDQLCEPVADTNTPELESLPQKEFPVDQRTTSEKPSHLQLAPIVIPPYSSPQISKNNVRKSQSETVDMPKPISTIEGCRIPTIVRSAPIPVTSRDIVFNDYMDHEYPDAMEYDLPNDHVNMHSTSSVESCTDTNKIIPVIGQGVTPSTTPRHKTKNNHYHHHHIPVVNKSNIVEVPTVDLPKTRAPVAYDSNKPVPELA